MDEDEDYGGDIVGINHDIEDAVADVFLDELDEIVASVAGPEGIVRLIEKLQEGLRLEIFEYIRPDSYFEAMEETLESLEGNCAQRNVPCPDPPSWHLIADTLERAIWLT